MLVLVCYDVSTETQAGRRRLRQVAKACQDHGVRVQFSVFECTVDPAQWAALRVRLLGLIEPKTDSLRFYLLGSSAKHKVEHVGARTPTDLDEPLIL
ncbi:MAG TPA: CRISPR-associated endonuclease Cas2 [Azospirillum sp.]|nr:CRISPR-associated endonuclease Cas2 [Azospirillum sp.]